MTNWITLPGMTEYRSVIALMEARLAGVIEESASEAIYLLEHDHVYTGGTGHSSTELLEISEFNHVPFIETGRGGKITYHGPGQRVIYPILDLRKENRQQDVKLYVTMLENWIINTMGRLGVSCYTIDGMVGIWTDMNSNMPAKIGAIGVRLRKWVTYHGIAVNISCDLDYYKGIIPCGISEYPVTSFKRLGIDVETMEFDKILKEEFQKIF